MLKRIAPYVIILAIGVIAYANSFRVPFQFDDVPVIVENAAIRDLAHYWPPNGRRYVGDLSFALNFAVSGLTAGGYHAVNLAIHLMNACLLYLLIVQIFRSPFLQPWQSAERRRILTGAAVMAALIFVAHPLQTQAVTYITQRYASLATLFCLLSLVFYGVSRNGNGGAQDRFWYGCSLCCLVLAMKTKEIAFTFPFIIVVYELLFLRESGKRRLLLLSPFVLCMLIIPFSLLQFGGQVPQSLQHVDSVARAAVQDMDIPRGDYLATQFRVILTYLRLVLFPVNQVLEYDYRISTTFGEPAVLQSMAVSAVVLAAAGWLIAKTSTSSRQTRDVSPVLRVAGFGVIWFYAALSVESSVIPIANVIFEHRMYLPSAGLFIAFAAVIVVLAQVRKPLRTVLVAVCCALVVMLTAAAYARNNVWASELSLWQDNTGKAPLRVKSLYNLGMVYRHDGRYQDAIRTFRMATLLGGDYPFLFFELGQSYAAAGWPYDAISAFETAVRLNPDYAEAHTGLGDVYGRLGMVQQAVQEYSLALTLRPLDAVTGQKLRDAKARLDQ